jgi:hypothetical protein
MGAKLMNQSAGDESFSAVNMQGTRPAGLIGKTILLTPATSVL